MSRSLSLTARQAIFAQETNQVFLLLLTISHASMTTMRVVNDKANIVSNGNTFTAYPFTITLPEDRDDQVGRVQLVIDNVDREIVQAVRSLTSAPTVTLEVVLASDPDTVEAGPFNFTLQNAQHDALAVSGELGFEDILNEPFPGDSFTPAFFPALF